MKFKETAICINSDHLTGVLHYSFLEKCGYHSFKPVNYIKNYVLDNVSCEIRIPNSQLRDFRNINIDAEEKSKSQLIANYEKSTANKLYDAYKEAGQLSNNQYVSNWKKFVKKHILKNITFPLYSIDINLAIYHCISRLLYSSNSSPKFIVVSPSFSALISRHKSFVLNKDMDDKLDFIHVGTYMDSINVFVNTNLEYSDNTVVIGCEQNNGEHGIYLIESDIRWSEKTDLESKTLALHRHRKIISTQFAESGFFTEQIELKNKPFWRKLFRL